MLFYHISEKPAPCGRLTASSSIRAQRNPTPEDAWTVSPAESVFAVIPAGILNAPVKGGAAPA